MNVFAVRRASVDTMHAGVLLTLFLPEIFNAFTKHGSETYPRIVIFAPLYFWHLFKRNTLQNCKIAICKTLHAMAKPITAFIAVVVFTLLEGV